MSAAMKATIGHTDTSDGAIPHFIWNGIQCPVKLRVSERKRKSGIIRSILMHRTSKGDLPVPLYRDGNLVFALPGGGEICPGIMPRKAA